MSVSPPLTRVWAAVAGALIIGAGAMGIVALRDRASDQEIVVFSAAPDAPGAGGWQLFISALDGKAARRLTYQPGDVSPSLSPDGARVAFERYPGDDVCPSSVCSQIAITSTRGGRVVGVTPRERRAESPDWSPGGDLIAYVEWNERGDVETDIYRVRADGTDRRRLTRRPGHNSDPAWSPDGDRIVYSAGPWGAADLYVMNADGSGQRRLTNTSGSSEYDPSWSPDGERIVFWRRGGLQVDRIVVMSVDGSVERTLTSEARSHDPVWSPDSKRIAYVREGNPHDPLGDDIWVMDSDGGNPHKFIDGPFSQPTELDWGAAP